MADERIGAPMKPTQGLRGSACSTFCCAGCPLSLLPGAIGSRRQPDRLGPAGKPWRPLTTGRSSLSRQSACWISLLITAELALVAIMISHQIRPSRSSKAFLARISGNQSGKLHGTRSSPRSRGCIGAMPGIGMPRNGSSASAWRPKPSRATWLWKAAAARRCGQMREALFSKSTSFRRSTAGWGARRNKLWKGLLNR